MASYRPTFHGSWVRIQRAKEHRDAINELAQNVLGDSGDWPTIGLRYDPQTDEHVLYVASVPRDFSDELERLSILAGEAVYNLRCALDYLVQELALWNTSGQLRAAYRTQFPITDSPDEWAKKAKRFLGEVHPNHQAVIKRFQTYHRPGVHPFKMLRQLNDTDKHRLLNVVMIPGGGDY